MLGESLTTMVCLQYGRHLTNEHRVNISAGGKGKKHRPFTEKTRALMSAAQKGIPKSPEHCAAISAGHIGYLGKRHTPETCLRISEKKKGVPNSKESNEKRSATMKGVPRLTTRNRIHITDGISSRMIKPDTIIPMGWRKGRK